MRTIMSSEMSQRLEAAQVKLKLAICEDDIASVMLRTLRTTLEMKDLEVKLEERSTALEQKSAIMRVETKARNDLHTALTQDFAEYKTKYTVLEQKLADKTIKHAALAKKHTACGVEVAALKRRLVACEKADASNGMNLATLQARNTRINAELTISNTQLNELRQKLAGAQVELKNYVILDASHLMEIARLNKEAALAKQKLDAALREVEEITKLREVNTALVQINSDLDDEVVRRLTRENPTDAERELQIALIAEQAAHVETKNNLKELVGSSWVGRATAAAEIAELKKANSEMLAELVMLRDIYAAGQNSINAAAPFIA